MPILTPQPFEAAPLRRRFTRGQSKPKGVRWFGVQSFWGHLRHLAAVAIATEDVDSRSWMSPDEPRELLRRVCQRLGGEQSARSLTESLNRDVWIDYLADTGDAAAVSQAVARLVFARYRLPDPERPGEALVAPRGDVLFFGGDTAYPVATAEEITNRILVPFNRVLNERPDERPRVLLGIPGNHDWYDGLDGFARMFRQRPEEMGHDAPLSRRSTTLIKRYATYAREFVRGGQIEKPAVLELLGYQPVQNASHFILPLAPGLTLFGVDRQLKRVDHRQQSYFQDYLNNHLATTPWIALPDPLYAFGEKSVTGYPMLAALGLRLHQRPQFFLSGDIHHYRRDQLGGSLMVTAGGGGAFLHPAQLTHAELEPTVEWPTRAQSRALLPLVPWMIALGRAGILPHVALLSLLAPVACVPLVTGSIWPSLFTALGAAATLTVPLALMAGPARSRAATWVLGFGTGIGCAGLALAFACAVEPIQQLVAPPLLAWLSLVLCGLAGIFGAAFLFGCYLALLTRFGLECTQAFTALDHPGFKHFVRFRVRQDGSAIDGYCIGLVDPLEPSGAPVLVDHFTFRTTRT